MSEMIHPALPAFVAEAGDEFVLAEVHLRRTPSGHELRHVNDRATDPAALRTVTIEELRTVAQTTAWGAFRPLKAAPNLRSGWRAHARTEAELERALSHLYPGGLADWAAARTETPPVTHYREFTGRQTGMYRITTHLRDAQAGMMIRSCCDPRFCLKRRYWTVEGLAPDSPDAKSALPCLDPCAVLLEFARKTARIEQELQRPLALGPSEFETLTAALEIALDASPARTNEREADFGAPSNPRRLRLLLERLRASEPEVTQAQGRND